MTTSSKDLILRIPSSFSIAGCFFIMVTYIIFPQFHKKRHVEIVFYIALNDLIGSVGICLGAVPSGTVACWFQSFTTTYNFLVSIFWTIVIMYQLYVLIQHKKPIENLIPCHLICWLFPLITALLPLTTNTYGVPDDDRGWCYIGNRSNSPSWGLSVWEIVAFYLWLWLAVAIIIIFFVLISFRLWRANSLFLLLTKKLYRLALYPIAFLVCWGIPSSLLILSDLHYQQYGRLRSAPTNPVYVVDHVLSSLQGFLLASIFAFKNKAVWDAWYNKLFAPRQGYRDTAEDFGVGATPEVFSSSSVSRGEEIRHSILSFSTKSSLLSPNSIFVDLHDRTASDDDGDGYYDDDF